MGRTEFGEHRSYFRLRCLNPFTIRSMCIVKLDFTRIGRRNYRYMSDKYELSNIGEFHLCLFPFKFPFIYISI